MENAWSNICGHLHSPKKFWTMSRRHCMSESISWLSDVKTEEVKARYLLYLYKMFTLVNRFKRCGVIWPVIHWRRRAMRQWTNSRGVSRESEWQKRQKMERLLPPVWQGWTSHWALCPSVSEVCGGSCCYGCRTHRPGMNKMDNMNISSGTELYNEEMYKPLWHDPPSEAHYRRVTQKKQ